jgi:hypothetical protein
MSINIKEVKYCIAMIFLRNKDSLVEFKNKIWYDMILEFYESYDSDDFNKFSDVCKKYSNLICIHEIESVIFNFKIHAFPNETKISEIQDKELFHITCMINLYNFKYENKLTLTTSTE